MSDAQRCDGVEQLRAAAAQAKANGKAVIVIIKPVAGSFTVGVALVEPLLSGDGTAPILELSLKDAAILCQDLVAAFKKIQGGEFKAS